MASILFKWFLVTLGILHTAVPLHPFYVSVVEIEHNAKEKTIEVSCKIFTDDFEKALRQSYHAPVDLLNPKDKASMDKLVNDYVQKHLKINVDGKLISMKYMGYEQIEEGIYSYYQGDNITAVKNISVTDNILYEYKKEQMGLLHITVGGSRKSTKLNNPDDKADFHF